MHNGILTNLLKSICLPRSFILLEMNIFGLSGIDNIIIHYYSNSALLVAVEASLV